jgi:alpha-L-arabinofuranosidase
MLQGSGVALTLYRNYFGKYPYKVSNSNGVIDVVAALDDDGYLTIAITNASERYYYIDIKGFEIISLVDAHVMEGDDPYSINSSGDMEDIRLVQKGTVDLSKNSVLSAPLTSTIYKLNVKKA